MATVAARHALEYSKLAEVVDYKDDLLATEKRVEALKAAGDALAVAAESGMNHQLVDQWEAAKYAPL